MTRLINVAKGWLARRRDARQLTEFAGRLRHAVWNGYPDAMWIPPEGPAIKALRQFNHKRVAIGFTQEKGAEG